jgi:hypothetical protein
LYYCTIYDLCTLVWGLTLALKSEDSWRKDYRQKERDPGLFKCVSCMYIVWGIFGVHGAEGPVACCMYADTDCFDTRLGCQQGFGMVVVWEDRYARLGYKRHVSPRWAAIASASRGTLNALF